METKPLVYQLIPKLMEAIGVIGKDRKNPLGFRYRGIEDALNNMQPHLVTLGLSLQIKCHDFEVQHFVEKGKEKDRLQFHSTLLMDVTFVAPDGSRHENTAAGEGLDTAGDKATNKAMAAAFKYAVFLGLCIPVEDGSLDDPDQHGRKQQDATPTTTGPVIPTIPSLPDVPIQRTNGPILSLNAPPASGLPMLETVRAQIVALIQSLDIPVEVVKGLIAKHGGTNLHDLPQAGGNALLAQLKAFDLEAQAKETFSKG